VTAELFQQIEQQGGVADLSTRCRFKLSGADRVRYLNGQVTNDVRRANSTSALRALVTDVKARIIADIFIHATDDALYFDAEGEAQEMLFARLERYIIADDAVLEDVTAQWQQWHVFGPAAERHRGSPAALDCTRLAMPGVDLWIPVGEAAPVFEATTVSTDDFETLRIVHGVPRYPNELNQDAFPAEAGLEESAVSFTKGCYIGQEIISRIKTTGKMPRTLVSWTAEDDASPTLGMELALPESPEKTIGIITSVAVHPVSGRSSGLAFIRLGSAEVDSRLLARGEPPTLAATVKLSGTAS